MTSLGWKINRLKLMGGAEIAWRVRQLAQKKLSRYGLGLCYRPPAPDSSRAGAHWLQALPQGSLQRDAICAAADQVLAGRWDVFALRGVQLGFPPQWNRDPKTGTQAPMVLGKAIDYRSERVVGDIKYLWEPSRHLELVALALAWSVSAEARYAAAVRSLLLSWLDQCPYPIGVHWTSSLELGVRLLNWAYVWQLLGGDASPLFEGAEGAAFRRRWLDAVYQHCHFISGYLSRHSSANNHLLGEYMGLFIASALWPCWRRSAAWQRQARSGFEQEALRQNFADGVNREQAVYYQHEVMDMMLQCELAARAAGQGFSAAYLERLERLGDFLHALMDCGGHMPMTGDADDARMVRLNYGGADCPYRSLLASCALLFGRADFKHRAAALDDKNRLLFGAAGVAAWDALAARGVPPTMAFPQGGYYLLGGAFDSPDEVRLVADCGPLGYLSIAAHGHADALAFTLSLGGNEMLVDPGTYAYHTQVAWRNYFRSTAAHNTVCVDDLDQSEIGGNFMWLRKANASALAHQPNGALQVFEGEHDGYARLRDPVRHRRRIEYNATKNSITVTDQLQCQSDHIVQLSWHGAETCNMELSADTVLLSNGGRRLTLQCNWGQPQLLKGSEAPLAGWISRRFDEKTAAPTALWRGPIKGDTTIVTELQWST